MLGIVTFACLFHVSWRFSWFFVFWVILNCLLDILNVMFRELIWLGNDSHISSQLSLEMLLRYSSLPFHAQMWRFTYNDDYSSLPFTLHLCSSSLFFFFFGWIYVKEIYWIYQVSVKVTFLCWKFCLFKLYLVTWLWLLEFIRLTADQIFKNH